MLRPDSNFERDMLKAFRWDPRNMALLPLDWVGRGFGWNNSGMEITLAPFDFKEDQLFPNTTLAPTLNPSEGVLFEDLGYAEVGDLGQLFDGNYYPFEGLDYEAVAYWELVSVTGGRVFRASRDVKGAIGQFPHVHAGDLAIDWNDEIAVGERIGFTNLRALLSGSASTGATVTDHSLVGTVANIAAAGELSRSFEVTQGQTANLAFKVTPASASSSAFTLSVFREVNGDRATLSDYSLPLTRSSTSQVVINVGGFGPGKYQAVISNTGTVTLNSAGVYKQDL